MTNLPKIFRVRQSLEDVRVEDVVGEVHAQLSRLELKDKIRPGASVAVTVGSRGIANIATITRAIVEHLKQIGAAPFIVPAMGSHGGGTAEGQLEVIESYGITEQFVGCPIRSSMETVVVIRAAEGYDVHFDRAAFEADHVVVCNRVKPHSDFAGEIESGLLKMLMIGLGKREGANVYHRAVNDFGFDRIVNDVADEVLRRCHILAGVGIVENAYDHTARIEAVPPERFVEREKELLKLAKRWMARLPFQHADLLVIDRIGKDISGVGMDPNIVGRKFNDHEALEDEFPKIKRIAIRGLSPNGHRNAIGLGIAEFCRTQLLEQADFTATRLNGLTSGRIACIMTPLDYPTDREMIETALGTIGLTEPPDAKMLWIADTMHLAELECSAAYLDEARGRDDLTVLTEPRDLPLDAEGNLPAENML